MLELNCSEPVFLVTFSIPVLYVVYNVYSKSKSGVILSFSVFEPILVKFQVFVKNPEDIIFSPAVVLGSGSYSRSRYELIAHFPSPLPPSLTLNLSSLVPHSALLPHPSFLIPGIFFSQRHRGRAFY